MGRVGWRSRARELRRHLKANPPFKCEAFVLVGWLFQIQDWVRYCDAILFEHVDHTLQGRYRIHHNNEKKADRHVSLAMTEFQAD